MEDEVLSAKEALRANFKAVVPFGQVVAQTNDKSVQTLAKEAGESPASLEFGAGLDFANWLVNRRRTRRFNRLRSQNPDWPVVVAEGDSWVLHPLVPDILDHLSTRCAVRSLAAAGAELAEYDPEVIITAIEEIERDTRTKVKHVLLSGGGNDLLGTRFGSWIREYSEPGGGEAGRIYLNDAYSSKVAELLKQYDLLLAKILEYDNELTVVVHGYDYVVPLSGPGGKWLGVPLAEKGYHESGARNQVVKAIVDDFNDGLSSLARQRGPRVRIVDARKTVTGWYDEIHPDGLNAQKVARLFFAQLGL
jgi:hypothetical protein